MIWNLFHTPIFLVSQIAGFEKFSQPKFLIHFFSPVWTMYPVYEYHHPKITSWSVQATKHIIIQIFCGLKIVLQDKNRVNPMYMNERDV